MRRAHESRGGRPTLDEALSLLLDTPEGMARTFGTLADARAAWAAWRDCEELQPADGLPPAGFWVFEPSVPAELRDVAAFAGAHREMDLGPELYVPGSSNVVWGSGAWGDALSAARRDWLSEG